MTSQDRWIFRFYNTLLLIAFPLIMIGIALRWRGRVISNGFDRWPERRGYLPESWTFSDKDNWWWVHAVSLGEVKAIEPFLRRVPAAAGVRVLLSCVTPEALAWATHKKVAERIVAAPIDLPWMVARAFRRVRPQLFVSVESEFWPNLLREAKRSGARVALINGRISERSYRRYKWISGLVKALWPLVDLFSLREQQDANRFAGLGVVSSHIRVTGHLKYDRTAGETNDALATHAVQTVVLGSTREGEEEILLAAIEPFCVRSPNVRIIWAPRHMSRVAEVESLLGSNGFTTQRKSTMMNLSAATAPHVIWDTLGDLLDAYQMADVAVVGGSFVDKGGQNPIEPAAMHRPVLFGPSMNNFKEIAKHLVDEGGARQIAISDLQKNLEEILEIPALRESMGERAQKAVQAEQGATDRTIAALKDLVQRG